MNQVNIHIKALLVLVISFTGIVFTAHSQAQQKTMLIKPLQDKVFIEERGQFERNSRTRTLLKEPVSYGVENMEFNAYFTKKGIIFQYQEWRLIEKEEEEYESFIKKPEEKTTQVIWHTATMEWVGANPDVEIIAEEKVSNYYNYGGFYGGSDDTTQFYFVPAYKKLIYRNLYPGVDVVFELPAEGGMKYTLQVKPNTNIPEMAFKWVGPDKISLDKGGNLQLKDKFKRRSLNSNWHIQDHAPEASTAISGKSIPVKYRLDNDVVSFEFTGSNISSPEGITIDPWITNLNYADLNRALDIQEDSLGNIFIQGNHSNYNIEKYNSAGVLQWTYVTYSVFLGDIAVDNPGNVYIIGGYCSGKRQKLNPAGVQQWSQGGLCEEWRLAINYSKTVVAVCGYFVNPGGNNLARLDMATGAVSDQIAYNEETRAIATDCNGDMFSLHLPTASLRKTNADFTPGGSAPSGLSLIYAGTGYALNPAYSGSVYQGFNGILVQGPYVYVYDGTSLRRFNKATLSPINTVTVPNGVNYQCSGLAADPCGNVYAGTTTGIVKYDSALNYVQAIPTSGPVYDIILSSSGNLLACGEGFLGSFSISCTPPPPLSVTMSSTAASCKGGTATVSATGGITPYSYLWEPGGYTTASVDSLLPGTYKCTVTDPFCHTYVDSVVVNPVPPVNLTITSLVKESCPNSADGAATVSATGGTTSYSFLWNTNPAQTTPAATGLAAGGYLVTVTDADSCQDTMSVIIQREQPPIAAFGATMVCNGQQTVFTDSSTTIVGSISSWTWDFGDASPLSTTQNTSHIYVNAGPHPVTLIIQTSLGCKDTLTKNSTVHYNPLSNFTFSNVCKGDSMQFTSTASVHNSSTIVQYEWSFGDNSTSTAINPAHLYSSAGTYTVTLTVTTNNGCKDTITKNVVVHALPVAQFTAPVNVCHGNIASFTDGSTIPNTDTLQGWSWNFADGSPLLNQQTVTGGHLYASTGTYNVSLITTSTFGCKDTVTKTVFVRPKPVANFGSSKVCNGTATVFSDSSTTSAGAINAWGWDFADGGTNITQNPSHLYANAGIHNVTLIAQNTFACADTVTKPVQVYFNPIANFTTQDVCLNDSVFFTDSSYVHNSASISTYLWVFGDGTPTSNLKNPAHFYATEGTYNVTLLSTTNQNCSNAANKTVRVFDPPTTNFSVTDVCLTDSAIFVNTSANPSMGSIASQLWSFGDGSLLNNTVANPHHLYSAVGTYPVMLITRSSNLACADTLTDSITVFPMPIADFAAADVCDEQAVSFFDSSTVTNGNAIAAWNWTFGDNGTSTLQNPTRTYSTFGQYSVQLIATTNNGCKDTISKNIVVHPVPVANFTTSNVCLGDSARFFHQSEISVNVTNDVITLWNWDFGDNNATSAAANTSYLYTGTGTYTVELKVVSGFGCADSINKTVIIHPNPVVNFTANDTAGCEPLCVTLSDASSVNPGANAAWSWGLGDDTTSNGATTLHCYNNDSVFAPQLFSVTLTVTSDSGCVSTLTKNNYITVFPMSAANFEVSPTASTITDPVINIKNLSVGATSWDWVFTGSTIDTSTLQHPPAQIYPDTGSYTMRLITNTLYNCPDTSFQTIVIRPDFMFYVPNAFTPNDDGVNDTFTGKGMFINEFEMIIFDRWGEAVYKTDNIDKPWDGKTNNGAAIAKADVYVYVIKVTDFAFTKHIYRGTVTLIR
jgi:gliding motility-associated-like protein